MASKQLQILNLALKRDEIINKINDKLTNSVHIFNSIGLEEGITGISLFNYFLFLDTQNKIYLDYVSNYLDMTFDYLLARKSLSQLSAFELLEIGKYLCFLNSEGFLDNESVIECLIEIEPVCNTLLKEKVQEKSLDAICGTIAIGHYLLEANRLISYKNKIESIIHFVEQMSISINGSIYWEFAFRNQKKTIIEFGFYHGIAGVLYFLALAFSKNFLIDVCYNLIHKGVLFLKTYQAKTGINLYPLNSLAHKNIQYQNLAYGDIGIAYTFYRIGSLLKLTAYTEIGIHLLENTVLFRDKKNVYIKDAELVYGSSGLFALYNRLHTETNNPSFKTASEYWFKKTLLHNSETKAWAGYETYINGFDNKIQLSFSHGICGIGIALITHKMGGDHLKYLSFLNYK